MTCLTWCTKKNLCRCGWYSVSSLAIVKLTQPFILVRSWLRGRQLTASGSMPASVGWSLQMKSGFWMMISSQFSPQVCRLNPVVWYYCQRELMKDLPLFIRIMVLLVGSLNMNIIQIWHKNPLAVPLPHCHCDKTNHHYLPFWPELRLACWSERKLRPLPSFSSPQLYQCDWQPCRQALRWRYADCKKGTEDHCQGVCKKRRGCLFPEKYFLVIVSINCCLVFCFLEDFETMFFCLALFPLSDDTLHLPFQNLSIFSRLAINLLPSCSAQCSHCQLKVA